jgi:hypothetical protein
MDTDPQNTLQILMENPQYSLQANFENEELINTVISMKTLQASIYAAISPNVNFCNPSHKVTFKRPFSKQFHHIHLTATSCDIGLTNNDKH